ncbi:MAG: hypothetical protein U0794_17570 [Isosphaeraceae bacterium]
MRDPRRSLMAFWTLATLSFPLWARADEPPRKPLVIPFDFRSDFDQGQSGRVVGEMFWSKLARMGGFILPESMQETRDWCERTRFQPGRATPFDAMTRAVRVDQQGDIGIWGELERVPGTNMDQYDLTILIVDFRSSPPRVLHRKNARTRSVSEIPHTHVKEAIETLTGQRLPTPVEAGAGPIDRIGGTSLVKGDFESDRLSPTGWAPLSSQVSLKTVPTPPGRPSNRFLHFEIPEDIAASTGVLYSSDFFPIQAGTTYRLQCRWRSSGSGVKVFIKGYDELPGKFSPDGKRHPEAMRREVYRSQQNLAGPANVWNQHSEDFTPRHSRYTPRWARVVLYGYWPPGTVDWDDVSVIALPAFLPP